MLRLYTSHYIAPSCGYLLVTSRHCHAHAATLSRAQRDNKNGERFAVVSKGVFDSLNLP